MVYKVKITKTYYTVRRGTKTYRYIKLIVNLPVDEQLLKTEYVYVLTPEEYENLVKSKIQEQKIENKEEDKCSKIRELVRSLFIGKKYVKLENVIKVLQQQGLDVNKDVLEECGIEVLNKGKEKGFYVKIPT